MTLAEDFLRRNIRNPNVRRVLRRIYRSRLCQLLPLGSAVWRGFDSHVELPSVTANTRPQEISNELQIYFENHQEGRGIWKWQHYFDIYERHFRDHRDMDVHVLEIGVYSGGSLEMWRDYFGPKAHVYGVDIEPACRIYETDDIKIFIGDQGDRLFWREFQRNVPALDIVVDDGSHNPEHQIVSLEELLPFLRPGGVYLCEDVVGPFNPFNSYVHGLCHKLNDSALRKLPVSDGTPFQFDYVSDRTPFQSSIGSIHFYPFVTVIERNLSAVTQLRAVRHGTQWQNFGW